jgi:hypothetical protein
LSLSYITVDRAVEGLLGAFVLAAVLETFPRKRVFSHRKAFLATIRVLLTLAAASVTWLALAVVLALVLRAGGTNPSTVFASPAASLGFAFAGLGLGGIGLNLMWRVWLGKKVEERIDDGLAHGDS